MPELRGVSHPNPRNIRVSRIAGRRSYGGPAERFGVLLLHIAGEVG